MTITSAPLAGLAGVADPTTATVEVDDLDVALLRALSVDARQSQRALARAVGMSPPAVADRLGRLERAGVIRGYRADVDPAALGFTLTAIINVLTRPDTFPQVIELAQRLPEVVECHRATGHGCFVLKVHATSIGHLESVLDQIMPLGEPTTSVVLSSPVDAKPISPPSQPTASD